MQIFILNLRTVIKVIVLLSICLFQTNGIAQQNILFVTSNQHFYGNTQIGAANHFEEIVVPYDLLTKAGFTVDFMSPKGGAIPIGYINASDSIQKKYLYDNHFMDKLKHTMKPTAIDAKKYAAIYYSGGGAAMYGVAENKAIQNIARDIYKNEGIVSAICHGTAGLAYLKDQNGKSLYAGKKITGYPDKFENKDKAYYKAFPFVMDQAIKSNEGNFIYSDKGWDSFYVVDGRFVTGQDPTSATKMTYKIIDKLREKGPNISKETISNLNKIFAKWKNDTPKPGVAAGLLKDGEVIYLNGFGSADVAHKLPITVDTKFQTGAMSKEFTAFTILLLAEQGRLSLSDDVRKYIPQLPDFGHQITIKHLLSQSSGLHDFWALKEIAGWRDKDVFTQKDALTLIFQQKKLDYIPGTKFSSTSSGMILLAEVVKKVTSQSLAAFTKEHIFQPLGMTNTLFCEDPEKIIPNVAVSYQVTEKEVKNNFINHAIVGPTNLYTSVKDLSRWYLNFNDPKVGSSKLIKKLRSPVTLDDRITTYNGLSGKLLYGQQFEHLERGIPKFWAYGLEGGYGSNIFVFPGQNLTAFVLGNNNTYNGGLAMPMAFEVLGDIFPEPPSIDFSKLKTIKVTAKKLETYSGNYWDEDGAIARRVYVKNDTLRYQRHESNRESSLVPIAEDVFQMVVGSDDVVIIKFSKEDRKRKMMVTVGESDEFVYETYQPVTYAAKSLSEFSGTYYCDALKANYTLHVNEKGLYTSNKSQPLITFTPIQTDVFLSSSWYFGGIQFKRDRQQNITGFQLNSDRVKNLAFKKIE
ncbi:serine hydrolase [Aquimarina sp. 2201CG1-2-11]|uniref:serine hydrolase n=1 Tax=Aquimarina discodermiae TaxID=3231043 RepID=UPI003462B48C